MQVGNQLVIERTEMRAGKVTAIEPMIRGRQAQQFAGSRIDED